MNQVKIEQVEVREPFIKLEDQKESMKEVFNNVSDCNDSLNEGVRKSQSSEDTNSILLHLDKEDYV